MNEDDTRAGKGSMVTNHRHLYKNATWKSTPRHKRTMATQLIRDIAAVSGRISRQTLYNLLSKIVLYAPGVHSSVSL
ncbi:hypothetical protein TNCV_3604651 [Trichonephila clavipes]|nr:hypothetical protein TNCV_3604651 [Trichonephila clavipes]